jgi:hypothetical protein
MMEKLPGGEHRNQAFQVQKFRAEVVFENDAKQKGHIPKGGIMPFIKQLNDGYVRCRRTLGSLFDLKGNAVAVIQ